MPRPGTVPVDDDVIRLSWLDRKELRMNSTFRKALAAVIGLLIVPATLSLALDPCNSSKVGAESDCGTAQICHDSGSDFCQITGTHDPSNCQMAARIPEKKKWTCVPIPPGTGNVNLHCVLEGEQLPCETWRWCYYSDDDLRCRESIYPCNLAQALNDTAISVACESY